MPDASSRVVSPGVLNILRRRPRFRLLYFAWALSMVGDWFTYVAVGLLAVRGPQGIFGVAIVQMAHSLPKALTAPLAGWLTDRMDRRALLVIASLARGLATLAMVGAAMADEVAWVEGLLFARMALQSFVLAPEAAAIPKLVEREELEPANRLIGTSWAIVFTMGVALGGLVTGAFGAVTALSIDAITFFVAAVMFARLGRLPPEPTHPSSEGSLLRDARLHPERARAAFAKVPTSLLSGAGWVILHSLVGAGSFAAYGLGALHAVRGVGNGLGPWILRRFGARGSVTAGVFATAAGALLVAYGGIAPVIAGCFLWGIGLGATWVGGSVWLARVVPDAILGRYAALDVGAYGSASALGGIAAALIVLAYGPLVAILCVASIALLFLLSSRPARTSVALAAVILMCGVSSPAAAQPAVRAALDARIVTRDHFLQRDLYSWTSEAQAVELRHTQTLLTSGPADGAVRAPYQVELDAIMREEGAEAELARLLSEDSRLSRRRYGWPTPYGTVISRGSRSYGPVLIHIRLSPDAITLRFAPEETPRFTAVDAAGRHLPLSAVLAHPEQIGAVLHERRNARMGAYREYVIHGQVESWSLETEAVRERVDQDLWLLRRLRRMSSNRGSMTRSWDAPEASLASRFAATMPFDTLRHRPTPATVHSLEAALRAQRPRVRPVAVHPP